MVVIFEGLAAISLIWRMIRST